MRESPVLVPLAPSLLRGNGWLLRSRQDNPSIRSAILRALTKCPCPPSPAGDSSSSAPEIWRLGRSYSHCNIRCPTNGRHPPPWKLCRDPSSESHPLLWLPPLS